MTPLFQAMTDVIHRLDQQEAEEERQQVALRAAVIEDGAVPAQPLTRGRQTQEEMARAEVVDCAFDGPILAIVAFGSLRRSLSVTFSQTAVASRRAAMPTSS